MEIAMSAFACISQIDKDTKQSNGVGSATQGYQNFVAKGKELIFFNKMLNAFFVVHVANIAKTMRRKTCKLLYFSTQG
jgi:hypothetical protein